MTTPALLPTIMIVEDDEHMMTLLQHLLEREGYHTVVASDGRHRHGA